MANLCEETTSLTANFVAIRRERHADTHFLLGARANEIVQTWQRSIAAVDGIFFVGPLSFGPLVVCLVVCLWVCSVRPRVPFVCVYVYVSFEFIFELFFP